VIYQILTGQFAPLELLGLLLGLVLGITVHEFAHAAAATWLGDSLPSREGRVTLAPHAHLDLMGALMFVAAGFGWGRPVNINPYALRGGPRTGPALVALAGPVSNLITAIIFTFPVRGIALLDPLVRFGADAMSLTFVAYWICRSIVFYNLILAFFNLIPVSPLDGFSVLVGILPPQWAETLERMRPYGFLLLILLMISGGTSLLLMPPVAAMWRVLIGAGG